MFWSVNPNDPRYQMIRASSDPEFWGSAPLSAALMAMQFDPHAKTAIEAFVPFGPSEFAMNAAKYSGVSPELYNFKGSITDWEGEGSFIMGMLALLNSKNVVEQSPVSFRKKNKTAAKAGQPLLSDHVVISIHTRYTKRNMDPDSLHDGRKHRAHWCRGHFKIRKTGVFFWSAHRRGADLYTPRPKNYEVRS
jgi:hypothetical protein